uniref:protein EARLY-RESPONSIVE TO DEHYDRATION 7, chloroplastic-like n=1 Tax=Erigeron canadensis TaxID=72917 RepID=UPI001CB9A2A8|nr:protein EARLY-RESPONSIVE TO DEHYDRATION 7, chloroplastic-like [Erigeron canadensis]
MASENHNSDPMYQKIDPQPTPLPSSSNPNQPDVEMNDVSGNLFPDSPDHANSPSHESVNEETMITVPGAILHLIDTNRSVELAMGHYSMVQLRQGENVIAILARVGDEVVWPLARDVVCVKLDNCHYFFSIRAPKENEKDDHDDDDDEDHDMLNYGLTIASKGQETLLRDLDKLLEKYTSFSVEKVDESKGALDVTMAARISPFELMSGSMKEKMEQGCSAYWTTLAPNVEDYSGTAAKLIAVGSGHLVKGILWCGDVTVDGLNRGEMVLKTKMSRGREREVSPKTLKRIKRVKKMTKMTEKVAGGVLSGVLKVSGYFSSSVANSKLGKKFFKLLPGEMALATIDGFSKVCEAFEVSGKNVMTTSSTVTTELVAHKYGEQTARATNEGLDAAGHAIGAAWTVFKIRTAVNPRSIIAPSALTKSGLHKATEEMRNKALKEIQAKEASKRSPKKSKCRRCVLCSIL